MFRLQEGNLPKEHEFPADLEKLGFFVNKAGQFRMIDYPDKEFQYRYSNNDRANEMRREAYQICQRKEVIKRLAYLGLNQFYLPQLTTVKPKEASVPILAPPLEVLKTRKRVLVLVNDSLQDLGILAYRRLQRELGVNGGSVINFAKEIINRDVKDILYDVFEDGFKVDDPAKETPGLVVMNCGQLLYSHKYSEAKTTTSWNALPRSSACHDAVTITAANKIEGNRDAQEHIRFVLDNVIYNNDFVAEGAEIYAIAVENGAENLLSVLDADFPKYGSRITAMALVESHVSPTYLSNPELKSYLRRRAREWVIDTTTDDPRMCIAMPSTYAKEVQVLQSRLQGDGQASPTKMVNWFDRISPSDPSSIPSTLLDGTAGVPEASGDLDYEPICPTFADAENPFGAGECILTAPPVQRAILDFFEEVASRPASYFNPAFAPVRAQSWEDSGDDGAVEADKPTEQVELDEKKAQLDTMVAALRDTPQNRQDLAMGRFKLEDRIAKKKEEIAELEREVQALQAPPPYTEQAGAGEETQESGNSAWQQVGGGPKVEFAGEMVDRDLLEAAVGSDFEDEMEKLVIGGGGAGGA